MSGSALSGSLLAQLVETMRALAGSHPGFRPVHAKGIVCSGTFRGAPDARHISKAVHLRGQAISTVIRFANASRDPEVHDGLANVRSLAVKFELADGKKADILANSIEGFPKRTPRTSWRSSRRTFGIRLRNNQYPMRSPVFSRVTQALGIYSAPDGETSASELRLDQLPCRARAFVHCCRSHEPVRPLSLNTPGCEGLISPLTMRASAARTSCAKSGRAVYETVQPFSDFSSNWPNRAIRPTTQPRCGPPIGRWLNWGDWR